MWSRLPGVLKGPIDPSSDTPGQTRSQHSAPKNELQLNTETRMALNSKQPRSHLIVPVTFIIYDKACEPQSFGMLKFYHQLRKLAESRHGRWEGKWVQQTYAIFRPRHGVVPQLKGLWEEECFSQSPPSSCSLPSLFLQFLILPLAFSISPYTYIHIHITY